MRDDVVAIEPSEVLSRGAAGRTVPTPVPALGYSVHGTKPHSWRVEAVDGMKLEMNVGPWAANSSEIMNFLNERCGASVMGDASRQHVRALYRDNGAGIKFNVDDFTLNRLVKSVCPDRIMQSASTDAIASDAEKRERTKAEARAGLSALAARCSQIVRAALREALGAEARNVARFIDALFKWNGCVAQLAPRGVPAQLRVENVTCAVHIDDCSSDGDAEGAKSLLNFRSTVRGCAIVNGAVVSVVRGALPIVVRAIARKPEGCHAYVNIFHSAVAARDENFEGVHHKVEEALTIVSWIKWLGLGGSTKVGDFDDAELRTFMAKLEERPEFFAELCHTLRNELVEPALRDVRSAIATATMQSEATSRADAADAERSIVKTAVDSFREEMAAPHATAGSADRATEVDQLILGGDGKWRIVGGRWHSESFCSVVLQPLELVGQTGGAGAGGGAHPVQMPLDLRIRGPAVAVVPPPCCLVLQVIPLKSGGGYLVVDFGTTKGEAPALGLCRFHKDRPIAEDYRPLHNFAAGRNDLDVLKVLYAFDEKTRLLALCYPGQHGRTRVVRFPVGFNPGPMSDFCDLPSTATASPQKMAFVVHSSEADVELCFWDKVVTSGKRPESDSSLVYVRISEQHSSRLTTSRERCILGSNVIDVVFSPSGEVAFVVRSSDRATHVQCVALGRGSAEPVIEFPRQPSLPGYVIMAGRGPGSAAVVVQRSEAVMYFIYGALESGFHAAVMVLRQSGAQAPPTDATGAVSKAPASHGPVEAIVEAFRKFPVLVCFCV